MCTTFTFRQRYFGRNMDIDYPFGEKLVAVPEGFSFEFPLQKFKTQKKMMGIASMVENTPLFAEAINESGLYMAGLNFPHNAFYSEPQNQPGEFAPYQLIPFFLSQFDSVAQADALLSELTIVNCPFNEQLPLAPLHFFLSDGTQTRIIEPTGEGVKVYSGVVPVLTNNPIYPDQLANLQRFGHLSPKNPAPVFDDIPNQPLGEGLGLVGLPGDFSPSSRFAKVSLLKHWMEQTEEVNGANEVLRLLDQVAMERGSVITRAGNYDITRYSVCYDKEGNCWWKGYDSPSVFKTSMQNMLKDLNNESAVAQLELYPQE